MELFLSDKLLTSAGEEETPVKIYIPHFYHFEYG
jgi:hypothetical protein